MTEDIMHMRKRVASTRREKSREGESKRRASLRKRRRTNYTPMEGSEDSESNSESNSDFHSEEDEDESEEMLPRWPQWDVTCGSKKGVLHVDNVERGLKECIESEGRWFSPSGFEEFGGKGTHKKWKKSIVYKNQPLNFWIDRGYLKPLQIKRHTFKASEPSKHKESHPEESDDESDQQEEPDELSSETSEEQTDLQNGEKTNCSGDTESAVSQRKPLLILHRLEGDFHLLLNDVALPQNSSRCLPTEKQSDDENFDTSKDDAPGPVETSESQEETSLHCSSTENEEQDEVEDQHLKDTVMSEEIENNIKNEEEIMAPSFQIDLKLLKIETIPETVIIHDSAQLSERPPQEDEPRAVLDEPVATPQTSTEENAMDLQQLKREKIKWQIKVLKLQEEYYSLQIQKLKQ